MIRLRLVNKFPSEVRLASSFTQCFRGLGAPIERSVTPAAKKCTFRHAPRRLFSAPPSPEAEQPLDFRRIAMIATAGTIIAFVGTLGGVVYSALRQKWDREAVQSQAIIEGNPIVYLDISDGDKRVGRLILQLRKDIVPLAAENFLRLCTAPLGYGFRNSALYGIEKGSRVFGGDYFGSGHGGQAYGGAPVPDEASHTQLRHMGPGALAMRTTGPNSINSQFYITLRANPIFDGVHPVIGYVMNDQGFEVLAHLDKCATANNHFRAKHDFRISGCGQLSADAADMHDADDIGELEAIGLAGLKLGKS